MPRVHMIAEENPVHFPDAGTDLTALCGKVVPNARPIFRLDLATGEIEVVNTITFCKVCFSLAVEPGGGRKYLYGVTNAQGAHEVNQ